MIVSPERLGLLISGARRVVVESVSGRRASEGFLAETKGLGRVHEAHTL